jgi:hypothetical protein
LVRELLAFKRRHRGVITNSDYYIAQIPRYVCGEMHEPCRSGIRTIHVDPAGFVIDANQHAGFLLETAPDNLIGRRALGRER